MMQCITKNVLCIAKSTTFVISMVMGAHAGGAMEASRAQLIDKVARCAAIVDSASVKRKDSALALVVINAEKDCFETLHLSSFFNSAEDVVHQTESFNGMKKLVKGASAGLQNIKPDVCFLDSATLFSGDCGKFTKSYMDANGIFIVDGKVFSRYLDEDFNVQIELKDWISERSSDAPIFHLIADWMESTAQLLQNYDQDMLRVVAENIPQPSYDDPSTLDEVRQKCLDPKYIRLKKDFPNLYSRVDRDGYRLIGKYQINKDMKCGFLAKTICPNVFFVKGIGIYSYATTQCKVREVTVRDIQNDMDGMKEAGLEEAAIIQHSELMDILQICQGLHDIGFKWEYSKPKVVKSCKPDRL